MSEDPNTSKTAETAENTEVVGSAEGTEAIQPDETIAADAPDEASTTDASDGSSATEATDAEAEAATTTSESTAPTENAEADKAIITAEPSTNATDANFKKKMKMIIIVGAAIILAALIAGGIVLANFFDENSLRGQMAEKLSSDPVVSELVLPGEILDETGFKVDDIQINSLDHAMFSDKATANVLAIVKNDCIQGYNRYTLSFEKANGAWELVAAETRSADYMPYAPISDDVVLAHLPELLAQVDTMNANIGYYPVDLAAYYGEGTQAEIISNEVNGYNDEISMSISTDRDSATLEGEFTIDLLWNTTTGEDPMWTTAYASATADTYYQIGSVPHEGVFSYATEADQADSLNQSVAWDEFYTHYLPNVRFGKSGKYALIGFENIPNNRVDMEFKITRDDTGETIYQSERITPNHCLDAIALDTPLEAGTYPATLTITSYEPGTDRLISMNSTLSKPITLTVSNSDLPF